MITLLCVYLVGAIVWAIVLLTMLSYEGNGFPNPIILFINIALWYASIPVFLVYTIYQMLKKE